MFSTFAWLLIAASFLSAAANPLYVRNRSPVTLQVAKRFNFTGVGTLLERDQARARGLVKLARAKSNNRIRQDASFLRAAVSNQVTEYIVTVNSLILDTGSSNTWVGAGKAFVTTSTSVQTKDNVAVQYETGAFSGREFTDTVSLGDGLTVHDQSIGVASRSTGFDGVDGILGLGPADLTQGTLSPDVNSIIPTFTDNLFSQGVIQSNQVSVAFAPADGLSSTNGEVIFGGIDTSKFTGELLFTPLTTISPASEFWGIEQAVRYGSSTTIMPKLPGVIDTGSTLTLFATEAFQRYQSATGAVLDANTGLLRVTLSQFANMQSLFITIGGFPFEFTPNAQIWPRNLNTAIGGQTNFIYLIIGDLGTHEGEGLDFIDSLTFLERFFAVFDTTNRRIGLATTEFTTATTN
ncbi:aspartic peptidase A1 [Panus rudis PR-1116 ss-1]|nr:aspartic peptidase A1 [Panus rudis PR-1116 ss-1]